MVVEERGSYSLYTIMVGIGSPLRRWAVQWFSSMEYVQHEGYLGIVVKHWIRRRPSLAILISRFESLDT